MCAQISSFSSPIGTIRFVWRRDDEQGEVLCALGFEDGWEDFLRPLRSRFDSINDSGEIPEATLRALELYFQGNLVALDALPVDTGGTPFQREVWTALREIPAGRTLSYGNLAVRVRRPRAARAVGAANGANPVSLAIPCHRVIASDGTLGGYGWGLKRKEWLLAHEGVLSRLL